MRLDVIDSIDHIDGLPQQVEVTGSIANRIHAAVKLLHVFGYHSLADMLENQMKVISTFYTDAEFKDMIESRKGKIHYEKATVYVDGINFGWHIKVWSLVKGDNDSLEVTVFLSDTAKFFLSNNEGEPLRLSWEEHNRDILIYLGEELKDDTYNVIKTIVTVTRTY